jgi:hypothetical protein
MPGHQYAVRHDSPVEEWQAVAAAVQERPEGFGAYFRGCREPNRYWEFEDWRYWRTSSRSAQMLNRCTLDSVESRRRVADGAEPIDWQGPPWAPFGSPWPPGWVAGPGPEGLVYRRDCDPRQDYPCRCCGHLYGLHTNDRPCPTCSGVPEPREVELLARGLV